MERKGTKSECDFIGIKNNRLNNICKDSGKICFKSINGLIKKVPCIYQFCNGDLKKFVLLLRKGVYPYEYEDSWERINETSLPDKKIAFYSELILEDITDKDYVHAQKVWEISEIKNLGEYHDMHVQCHALLLVYVFENFRETCIEIYALDIAHFLSAPGLVLDVKYAKQYISMLLETINL